MVENRDGAGGIIGTDYVINTAPDGYIIEYLTSSTLLGYAAAGKEFRAGEHIDPVAGINQSQTLWTVNPNVIPVKTLDELMDHLKANPGESYATVGVGSTAHLTMLKVAGERGLEVEHIPYRGGSAATAALVAGEIGLIAGGDPASALPHIRSGAILTLAVSGPARMKSLPDVQTTTELGYPDIITVSFGGFAVPHGTPQEVADVITGWVKGASEDEAFRKRLEELGTEVVFRDPATFIADLNANTDNFEAILEKYEVK
ncbi:hypothetical protein GVY41_19865 [Frigidibacter albus]|uniref:Tripartite tricarboxylate transporter substrate binding protein n=1 Tax=Frigidibacter albus TaxID=1465486 RepID=A0A6L8VPD6_9RHOB|nr:tripartite tricarboxylate transporter substrate binding protein [Frigidibacter albus]MZQ91332.1 hypothetical protein [Frigidibacter albus]NBE33251.1 hypothetical protein [Frigidibacter albus]GGH64057.1 hypothetical protein GCM10011341_39740 [Frigidibacter albus]